MLKTDRKLKNAIVKLKPLPGDEICYNPKAGQLQIIQNYHDIIRFVPFDVPEQLVPGSIQRLIDAGFLVISEKFNGGFYFSITDLFILRNEYWWDNFSHKFIFGYITGIISGIIVTVIGGLLLAYIRLKLGI